MTHISTTLNFLKKIALDHNRSDSRWLHIYKLWQKTLADSSYRFMYSYDRAGALHMHTCPYANHPLNLAFPSPVPVIGSADLLAHTARFLDNQVEHNASELWFALCNHSINDPLYRKWQLFTLENIASSAKVDLTTLTKLVVYDILCFVAEMHQDFNVLVVGKQHQPVNNMFSGYAWKMLTLVSKDETYEELAIKVDLEQTF